MAAFYDGVSEPVVSPDGTIWVRGPRAAHVTQLSREGRMRRWFRAGGADENDPKITAELGPLMPLPNGRVVAAIYELDPRFPGGFAIMDPQRAFSPADTAEAGALLMGLDYDTKLAVGPGGMVYATGGNKLYATCRGERLMWTLSNELLEPGEDRFGYLRVEGDGTVIVSGATERVYHVDPNTHEVDAFQPIAMEEDEVLTLVEQTNSTSLFYVYDGRNNDLVVRTDADEFRVEQVQSAYLSPHDMVLFWQEGALFALDPPYTSEPRSVRTEGQFSGLTSWWRDDGEWVGLSLGISRFNTAGEEVWNAPISFGGEDVGTGGENRIMTMDDAGVVFSSVVVGIALVELAAFQTDGLPPPTSVCVQDGCNAHRDRWVRPAAEIPAE